MNLKPLVKISCDFCQNYFYAWIDHSISRLSSRAKIDPNKNYCHNCVTEEIYKKGALIRFEMEAEDDKMRSICD